MDNLKKISLSLILGFLVGFILNYFKLANFGIDWIKPFGDIFLNLLKLISVPLVFVSIINSLSGLKSMKNVSKIGIRTISIFLCSTFLAVCIGVCLAIIIKPGVDFSNHDQQLIQNSFSVDLQKKNELAKESEGKGPLYAFVEMFSSNLFSSFADNSKMLQVIIFAIFFGLAMIHVGNKNTVTLHHFFKEANDIMLQIVSMIMVYAPIGVFAIMASLLCEISGDDPKETFRILKLLGIYSVTVIVGLGIVFFINYSLLIKIFSKIKYITFLKNMAPVFFTAFTTSSSSATLPFTLKVIKDKFQVKKEVADFVLPLGATINMDGTSLYQSIAAIFIAQVFGIDLSMTQIITIIFTSLLASIGAAAIPGAGIVTLILVLTQAGIPSEGIALILVPDRILDQFRTTVNVTGDTVTAIVVNESY